MIATDKSNPRVDLPMPFGWFQVLYSHELKPLESKPLSFFNQEMVAFRTESGEAKVVDAYCPHMGAHLGYGIHEQTGKGSEVIGDSIVCPFHGWRYNGEGQCTHIPYANRMPPRIARGDQVLPVWHVREMNQTILVWYHPEGVEPMFEPLEVPEAAPDNEEWGDLKIFTWDINTHMQEIGENAVDAPHFHYVHGTDEIPPSPDHVFEGHTRSGFLKTRHPTPRGVVDGSIENYNSGPGMSRVRFSGLCETVLMANLTPVTPTHSRAMYAFIQKKVDGKTPTGGISDALVADICKQMEEDRIIWDRKKFLERPTLCDGDGPIMRFRRWYGQFLVSPEKEVKAQA